MANFMAASDVVACDLDGGSALLNLETSEYFKLNSTGAIIWQCVADGSSLEGILDRLCEEFDVAREDCRKDVEDLLGTLEEAGLVARAS